MRAILTALTALTALTLFAGPAQALTLDAKKLARYDASYQRCETMYPEMKGQRDVAYLRLYHVPEDEKMLGKLAALRKSSAYVAEQKRLKKTPVAPASAASGPLAQQCQGLWGEAQRAKK
ncbi:MULTISPECIES: hypothetical protein [unclassified Rhizobacter]|uniref:hypothetical protein n=1 Tax=unclassified Rhizobacter TaxID=2640088 RepID=UPI0006FDF8F7|nr:MULTISPECIES: hypothetical protein [unclassified Rhizobacter]KQU78387.1 hypothetical protein ASC88_21540 [Rhizobacter sp. Root29]KQW10907.1 hypothetical protein ASC98_02830 [Rhizobacter sp. Root1238]KRB25253.1 hypothetical protein ASE08_03515 [Rhizobacter sp. Root16D2]